MVQISKDFHKKEKQVLSLLNGKKTKSENKLHTYETKLKTYAKKEKKLFKNSLRFIGDFKKPILQIENEELNKLRAYKTKELEKLKKVDQAVRKLVLPQNTKNLKKGKKSKEPLHPKVKALKQFKFVALKNLEGVDKRLKELEQKERLKLKGYLHKEATKLKSAKLKLRSCEKRELDAIRAYKQREHNQIKYVWGSLKRFSKGSIGFLASIPANLIKSITKKEAKNHEHLRETNPLKRAFFRNLNTIKKEKSIDKAFDSFCWLFKGFLKKRFHINYEFTFEELIRELETKKLNHNINGRLVELYSRMKEFEYAGRITEKKLKTLIRDTEDVIKAI